MFKSADTVDLDPDLVASDTPPDITQIVPARRLNVLLEQAVMYQRSRSDAGSSITLPCRSLLRDYEVTGARSLFSCFLLPQSQLTPQALQRNASAVSEEKACIP